MEPEPPGAGADPSRSEPEWAPGPWPPGAGATQKSGGSATLQKPDRIWKNGIHENKQCCGAGAGLFSWSRSR